MKTYIVYVKGIEAGYIKAASHNAAERRAQAKYTKTAIKPYEVSVAYTEL